MIDYRTIESMDLTKLINIEGSVHLTGVKGTGMAALAEILWDAGIRLSGSDVAERFYTDDLLDKIGLVRHEGFGANHVAADAELLIYSAAYDEENPERREAARRGIPQYSYTEMLGLLSRARPSLAVSGIHGKTSISAMIGTIVKNAELPVTVLVGSGVPNFGGSATWRGGDRAFIAETCEYRRHFLSFSPAVALVSNVEAEHLDYFADAADVENAFLELLWTMPNDAPVVFCSDDPGARMVVERALADGYRIRPVPYGQNADGPWRYVYHGVHDGAERFSIAVEETIEWSLPVPGVHMVENAVGALAALTEIMTIAIPGRTLDLAGAATALAGYRGTRRRSELVGDRGGVRVIDDYAHHPRAIRATLEAYRSFYPNRRLIVDFMSHTYTRTKLLLDEFVESFDAADVLIVNDIYASAREHHDESIDGPRFAAAIARRHGDTRYEPDFSRAADMVVSVLRPGDVFVTMGAGDNFRIASMVLQRLEDTRA